MIVNQQSCKDFTIAHEYADLLIGGKGLTYDEYDALCEEDMEELLRLLAAQGLDLVDASWGWEVEHV